MLLLADAVEFHCVADLPVGIAGWADVAISVALADETAVLAASGGKSASFTAGVSSIADPVELSIVLDGWVGWVDEDAFVVLEGTILVNPVGVKEAESWELLACLVLGDGLKVKSWGKLIDMVGTWLTIEAVLGSNTPAGALADADAVDAHSLLGLVAHATSLIWAGRVG